MKNKKENLILLLIIGVYLSMNTIFLIKYANNPVEGDALLYKNISLALINGDSSFDAFANITPGYPEIIALIYSIFGKNDLYVFIFQIFLGLAIILLLYKVFSIISKSSFIALFFSGLLVANYSLWKFNVVLLMEIVTVFLLTLSIYFLILYFYKKKKYGIYLFVTTFTVLVFINNRFIFHGSALFIFFFLYFLIKNELVLFIKITSLFLILLLPWFIFQYQRYNQFVFFTPLWNNVIGTKISILPRVKVYTIIDKEKEMFEKYKPNYFDYKNEIVKNSGTENAREFTMEDYKRIMSDFNDQSKIKLYRYRLYRFFIPVQLDYCINGPGDYRLIYPSNKKMLIEGIFITMPLLALALIGIILSICQANVISLILSLLYLSHIVLHIMFGFVDRYRYSILPVVYILACYSCYEFLSYLSKYPRYSFLKRMV